MLCIGQIDLSTKETDLILQKNSPWMDHRWQRQQQAHTDSDLFRLRPTTRFDEVLGSRRRHVVQESLTGRARMRTFPKKCET